MLLTFLKLFDSHGLLVYATFCIIVSDMFGRIKVLEVNYLLKSLKRDYRTVINKNGILIYFLKKDIGCTIRLNPLQGIVLICII